MAMAMVVMSDGASSGSEIGGTSGGVSDGGACNGSTNDNGSGSVDSDGRWHEDGSIGKICTHLSLGNLYLGFEFKIPWIFLNNFSVNQNKENSQITTLSKIPSQNPSCKTHIFFFDFLFYKKAVVLLNECKELLNYLCPVF
jgi:hypothetical protein